jgi:hypothetical protein
MKNNKPLGKRAKTQQRVQLKEDTKYLVEKERTQIQRLYLSEGREDWRRFDENSRF